MPIPVSAIYDNSNIVAAPPQPAAPQVPDIQAAQDEPSILTAANPASPAASQQLQAQLDDSLKNSGIKAEIENEKAGLVIVRFVQADTGQVILQMPPQGVLDLIAQMDQKPEESPLAGNMVDTSA